MFFEIRDILLLLLFYFIFMMERILLRLKRYVVPVAVGAGVLVGQFAFAAEEGGSGGGHGHFAVLFLWIAVLLLLAKFSSLVERWGQPSVLGELVMGVILGNLALIGIHWFEPIKQSEIISFFAELGVVILLFQIGLESNIADMKKVGTKALGVAMLGVIVPFVLGTYIVGPWLMPGLDQVAYLFLGAAMTATSVGITARVFKDLGKLQIKEAQIILGAAVIDDVMGLIILAVISAIATVGAVSAGMVSVITGKAILFLVGSIVLGQLSAKILGKWFSKIHTGVGMKFTLAVVFALVFSWVAGVIGLAPIVGAFAAGLVLDPVHFKYFKDPHMVEDVKEYAEKIDHDLKDKFSRMMHRHSHRHIEDLIEPLGHFFVPIFFIVTGMAVNLETMFNPDILLVALGITIAAFVGKLVAGAAAGNVNKWLVGWGMAPRGEVGLIFATIGKGLGVVSDEVFSVIIIMVIFTTLLTPPILSHILRKDA